MGRHNSTRSRNVKVTREVIAMANIAAYRAGITPETDRVLRSRRITRRMLKGLRAA